MDAVKDLTDRRLATALCVSEATVKTRLGRLLNKLDPRDRVQAVVFAYLIGSAPDDFRGRGVSALRAR